jgi:16S rRNA (cytosine1402-N4)-methyltransferase
MGEHIPVLLTEAVEALVSDTDGLYVDGTYGRGGHSFEILNRLSERGSVLAIDKDPEAINDGRIRFNQEFRISFCRESFACMPRLLEDKRLDPVSGILLDLGVSSPQLESPSRGFSFQTDGPLDMRMDNTTGESAADWLQSASKDDIASVIKEFGGERYARRISAAIVSERFKSPIDSTKRLAEIIKKAHPSWVRGQHPATKSFQGIRIYINRELQDLDHFLEHVVDMLKIGGRLVVISFHSLEDRRVKRFIRDQERREIFPRNLPIPDSEKLIRLVKIGTAIKPSKSEIMRNNRARSAVMRVAERVA